MPDLDDFLQLELKGSPLEGSTPLSNTVRPTAAGLQWLTAPSSVAGLAYRCVADSLERLQVTEEGASTVCSCPLNATAVQIAASSDGRLVAVACTDGSLQCFDSTAASMTPRWSIPNAHSHSVGDPSTSPSSGRSNAAAASGPVRSLGFSPSGYDLLLVDNTALRIFHAASSAPTPLASLENATSASWFSNATLDNGSPIAVGKSDGSIDIYNYQHATKFESISQLGCPSDEDGFSCTHLDWDGDSLVAGMCRVIPSDDEPDEDDEDDTAEHEACLYITTIDTASYSASEWSEQGDVVPFFTVPKSGRHVYFTSVLKSSQNMVIVASNVGSDVGALAQDGSSWTVIEFQEGAAAMTPTDDDDEFTFPVGVQVVQLVSSAFRLLLASTDGSISTYSFENEKDPSCFAASLTKSTAALPESPVETVQASAAPDLADEPPVQDEPTSSASVPSSSAFSFGHSSGSTDAFGSSATPFGVTSATEAKTPSAFGGTTTASAFGSSGAPAFGSGLASGLSFGAGTGGAFSFGSSGFGAASPLGGAPASVTSTTTPAKSASSFGSTFVGSSSAGGFGALASSSKGNGIFASNQFNAFDKPVASSLNGMPVKPLFDNTPTKTTPAVKPAGASSSTTSAFGGSIVSSSISAFGTVMSSTTPFGASGSTASATSAAASMSKPLFGAPNAEVAEKSSSISHSPPAKVIPKEETPTKEASVAPVPESTAGKKAARVFDQIDEAKTGSLPIDKFDDLAEELGEGFYGDEKDLQIKLIDPLGSNKVARARFIDWYTTLVEGGNDDGVDSVDTAEREERAEEEEKARAHFGDLSTEESGIRVINVSDMEDLITNLGSTYGEDEFRKVIRKLKKPSDKIHEEDFVAWYLDWLFGDDDGSDFEDDDDDDDDNAGGVGTDSATAGASSTQQGLGSLFQVKEGSWKCDVCSVRNPGDLKKCSACETVRPGHENDPDMKGEEASTEVSGSIGAGGFSFGGAANSGSIGSSGFSFGGGTSASTEKQDSTASAPSGRGFSFGGTDASTSAPSGEGFTFRTTSKTVEEKAPGFALGTSQTTKVETHSSCASFPPMSSKAPTPFGASKKNAAFPPLSARAAPPFGAATQTPPSPAAFPPMATKAPTPFRAVKNPEEKPSTAAAFPPMSAKAPTPFGAVRKTPPSSAAFPPMATKAPTPFGTVKKPEEKPSTAAAFPPMSAKAPTPFGAATKSPTKPASSVAFPPMSVKSPTPFGAAKMPSSAAFPPMSAKPPTPFSATAKPVSKSSTAVAFPPMSTKVPTPFGGDQEKTSPSPFGAFSKSGSKTSTSSAFPPMSTKAPTPFGATTKPQTKPTSSAAFPPMPTKAQTPFGAAEKPETKSSSSAAFPPMSNKAPTPFGAAKKPEVTPVSMAQGSSTLPPMPTKAPTPFGTGQANSRPQASIPTSLTSKGEGSRQSAASSRHLTSCSVHGSKMTEAEAHFTELSEQMDGVLERLESIDQATGHKLDDMGKKIESLVGKVQQARFESGSIAACLVDQKKQSMFYLSRKTDTSRQIGEARELVDTNSPSGTQAMQLAKEQPLDFESEQNRRRFATSSKSVHDQFRLFNNRLDLYDATANLEDENGTPIIKSVMDLHRSTKHMGRTIEGIESKVAEASKSIPLQSGRANSTPGRTTYGLSPARSTPSKKERLRPLLFLSEMKPSKPKGSTAKKSLIETSTVEKWEKMEAALQDTGSQQAKITLIGGLSRRSLASSATLPVVSQKSQPKPGRSLLLSPPERSIPPAASSMTQSSVIIFSPPSKARPRTAWDQVSHADQTKLKHLSFSLPKELNEVTVSNKARAKLATVGTTPEKVQESLNLNYGDRTARLSPRPKRDQSSSSKSASDPNIPNEGKEIAAASFPPMPTNAPTSFSRKSEETFGNGNASKSNADSSYPSLPSAAPKPFSSHSTMSTNSKETNEQSSSNKLPPKAPQPASLGTAEPAKTSPPSFGDMKGLGNSLFSPSSSSASNEPSSFPSPKPTVQGHNVSLDYRQILNAFYQKHNPAKMTEVDKTLEKYKGREVEMFKKLAAKYKVPSPLDNTSIVGAQPPLQPPSAMQAVGFGNTAPAPSPFLSSSGTINTTSAFGSSNPSASASPFGNAQSGSLASASPFGSSAATSSFGSSGMPSASPFGATSASTTQASPFGSQASAQPQTVQNPSGQQPAFQGRNPREMLMTFYQQKNPSKIAEVDKVLQKYRGNEEQLFRNLAKKYQLDPSVFGLPAAPPGSAFGSTQAGVSTGSGFGSSGPASFGQQSSMGGSPSPFGQGGGGFGQPSTLGGGTMVGSVAPSFGASAGSSFGGSGFGSLASSPSPFGAAAPVSSNFGSPSPGFGSPQSGAFGGATPFGAARR